MILGEPVEIACWTEAGRNDMGVEVGISSIEDGSVIQVSAPGMALTQVVLRWRYPVPEAALVLADHWERGYGDLEWRGIVPERVLPWYALIHSLRTGETLGVGVETRGASVASWRVDQQGIMLVLDLRCGARGVHLGDRTLVAATVRSLRSTDEETPFAFAQRFCRALCPAPRLPAFPVYGGNDWYYAYGNNSDETIRRDAGTIRALSPNRDNAPFMVIDAGWFPAEGCGGGPYTHGNARFPDMAALAQGMKAEEVRPGIWIRPLLTASAPASWQLPAAHPITGREPGVVLDPSVPEVLDWVRQDISRLREWGYTLIKHDFTTYDITGRWGFGMGDGLLTSGDWSFADTGRTTAEIVRDLYGAIREAAQEVVLIGCNTIGHLGAGLFELQRTGDDTSGKEWERTRKMGINTLAFRMPQHNAFFCVDADCVGLTPLVPWELNRQWLDVLARSGTPLFVSADPEALGTEQRGALRTAFAQAAEPTPVAEPLDWLHTTCPRHWRFGESDTTFDWIPDRVG